MRRAAIALAATATLISGCTGAQEVQETVAEEDLMPPVLIETEGRDLSEMSSAEATEHLLTTLIDAGADRFRHTSTQDLVQAGIGRIIDEYGLSAAGAPNGVPEAALASDTEGVWVEVGTQMEEVLRREMTRWARIEPLLNTSAYQRPEIDRLAAAIGGLAEIDVAYYEEMLVLAEQQGPEGLVGSEAMAATNRWFQQDQLRQEAAIELADAFFALPIMFQQRTVDLINLAAAGLNLSA